MKNEMNILVSDTPREGILRLTMDDQKSGNALSEEMMSILIKAIEKASIDDSVKVIILAAEGSIFSSGHNLKQITDAREQSEDGEPYFKQLFDQCSSLMQLLVNCPKPVIAQISGIATAAGLSLIHISEPTRPY